MTSTDGASTAPEMVQDFEGAPVMSRGLMFGIILVLVAESVALHALVYSRWPLASLALHVLNLLTIGWIWREGTAASHASIVADRLEVRHGRATHADIPLGSVRDVRVPTWQELPPEGTGGYVRLVSGDDPNVLLTCDPPATLRMTLGIRRRARLLGLRLEAPQAFVKAVVERVRT